LSANEVVNDSYEISFEDVMSTNHSTLVLIQIQEFL